jgi:hypothetical protein
LVLLQCDKVVLMLQESSQAPHVEQEFSERTAVLTELLGDSSEEVFALIEDAPVPDKLKGRISETIVRRLSRFRTEIRNHKESLAQNPEDARASMRLREKTLARKRYIAELPYLIGYQPQELSDDRELLATLKGVHATSVENMAAALLWGELMPGTEAKRMFRYIPLTEKMHKSQHPADGVCFSIGEVNPQYGLQSYPDDVSREWVKPSSECFFVADAGSIIDSNPANLEHAANYLFKSGIPHFDELVDSGLENDLPSAFQIYEHREDYLAAAEAGSLTRSQYVEIIKLTRKMNGLTPNLSQREIRVKSPVPLDETIICFPTDFVPEVRRQMHAVAAKMREFADVVAEAHIADIQGSIEGRLSGGDIAKLSRLDAEYVESWIAMKDFIRALKARVEELDLSDEAIEARLNAENVWTYDPEIPSGRAAFAYLCLDSELMSSLGMDTEHEDSEKTAVEGVEEAIEE